MALSADAHSLLNLLKIDGGAANVGPLKTKLGLDDDAFVAAQGELIAAGLADLVSQGRLARTNIGVGNMSVEATMMLAALPADGSTVGNYSLRSQLDLDDETYKRAKQELRAAGLLKVGVGYGGTVGRVNVTKPGAEVAEPSSSALVKLERELYEPFAEWLRASLADQDLAFAEAKITATPKGYKYGGGRWSRPDITAVQVFRYDWLPDITVEVSSYEIKRAVDARKLESVYEAAAHGRWAHRASLVVEQTGDGDPVPAAIFDEVRRFRLGLYAMRRRPEGGFDVREIAKPPLTPESQPEDVNELLGYFLGDNAMMRQSYRRAIGQ